MKPIPSIERTRPGKPGRASHVKRQAFQAIPEDFKRERSRKNLYIRSIKLDRSKQLVIDSPRVIEVQL